jgi:hypothetical protein
MKAILIRPDNQTVEQIELAGVEDISKHIGFDTITSDEIGPDGDRLYFDEECFLRGSSGRFQIDTVVPVSGPGLVVGSPDNGHTLRDTVSDPESIRARVKYL